MFTEKPKQKLLFGRTYVEDVPAAPTLYSGSQPSHAIEKQGG